MSNEIILSLLAAFIATFVSIVALATDFRQWQAIRKINVVVDEERKKWEERGSFGEQMNDWLMSKEAPEKPTTLEILSASVGATMATQIFGSMKGQQMGIASGESRHLKMVEEKVMQGLEGESPELALVNRFAEKIGLTTSDIPLMMQILNRYGGLGSLLKKGGNQGSW